MITAVNHLAYAAANPAETAAAYATLFGRKADEYASASGELLYRFRLANMAFEITGAHDGVTGLSGLGFEAADMDATTHKLSRRGLTLSETIDETWVAKAGGQGITRRSATIATASGNGVPLRIVETATPDTPPAIDATSSDVISLDHVVIRSPNPERAIALYGARLGLDFALDRSNPDWGSRLMFFRTGGTTVEIGHSLAKGISDQPDSLWGVAWRVHDAAITGERLKAAGLNTSDASKGRRPGSKVLTVRSETGDVPTILLSAIPKDTAAA
jgi:catechol 2,3-dioxygenase-like lactoylglutathione lyase family enzyme